MNPFNPEVPMIGADEPQLQLPPLRTWVVTCFTRVLDSDVPDKVEDLAIEAHALQHDQGVLSFLVYTVMANQPVGQIRYLFNKDEWYRVRELVTNGQSQQTH